MFCTEMTGSWLGPGIREFDQDDGCRNAESQQKNLGVYNALWMKPVRNISLIMRQSANAFSEETQAHRVHGAHSAATIPASHVTLACQDVEGACDLRAGGRVFPTSEHAALYVPRRPVAYSAPTHSLNLNFYRISHISASQPAAASICHFRSCTCTCSLLTPWRRRTPRSRGSCPIRTRQPASMLPPWSHRLRLLEIPSIRSHSPVPTDLLLTLLDYDL
jgi:hypothetical protein